VGRAGLARGGQAGGRTDPGHHPLGGPGEAGDRAEGAGRWPRVRRWKAHQERAAGHGAVRWWIGWRAWGMVRRRSMQDYAQRTTTQPYLHPENMKIIIRILLSTIAVLVADLLLSGVHAPDLKTGLLVAVVLGVLNAVVRPLLLLLTLPVTVITLGLFVLVINAAMVMLAA